MKKRIPYSYCIFYLERKFYHKINDELKDKGYKNIRAIVPTVKILRKTIKGKMIFEEEPILFNFGFIKMPTELAYSRPFLNKLKRSITGIRSWLRSTETLHERRKKARIDNAEDFDDFSMVAICSRKEVRRFQRLSRKDKKYSLDNLNLNRGDYLVLKGYPYDGVDATIIDIDFKEKMVDLLLYPENGKMQIRLPFDNVLYSVYQNYDPDKLYVNQLEFNENNITEEGIQNIMDIKQH